MSGLSNAGGGLRPREPLHQHDEFVAAHPRQQIGIAQPVLQPRGDQLQQFIAGAVAEAVVDVLEMVEVEEQECALFAGAASALDGVLEARDQKQPVRQSGQEIVLHEIFQLGFLLPEETVGRQHAGNEQRAVQHHIGHGLVDMAEQIEQVGDMAIQREEQFRQAQHPGAGGQPVQIDVAPLRAAPGQRPARRQDRSQPARTRYGS